MQLGVAPVAAEVRAQLKTGDRISTCPEVRPVLREIGSTLRRSPQANGKC